MPRSLVVGNGNLFVDFDAGYCLRDLYQPRVGEHNQTLGNPCRTGIWVDGRFSWLDAPDWQRTLGYELDSVVTDVRLSNPALGADVSCCDYVDMARNWLLRRFTVRVPAGAQAVRLYLHYDWYIGETDIGNTVAFDPRQKAVIAYRGAAYFLVGGQSGAQPGISSWACGKKGGDRLGTWVDAEDGVLGRNPIEQGAVDCVVELDLGSVAAGAEATAVHWVCSGATYDEVTRFGQDLLLERGEETYYTRTLTYWRAWSEKDHAHIDKALGEPARRLYRRSLLVARLHADNGGAVIAATDYDITKFARDTYAYMWPRDGALVANALDRAGHEDVTRRFFLFCRDVLLPGGYFAHKYTPSGNLGSSWHPWMDASGRFVAPIQEDETALVLWALWEHYRLHRNLDFAADLYSTLVMPAADWMTGFVDSPAGLPCPSWDLWEERWGVHAWTAGAIAGGLGAAASMAELFGDHPSAERYRAAVKALRAAVDAHLWRPELGRFARRVNVDEAGRVDVDTVLDSSVAGLWRFGLYAPDDERITATMTAVEQQLLNRGETGGIARYSNDYYFQVDPDVAVCPGNPWFICTLWVAQWRIATARATADLAPAREVLDWVVAHALPGGLLSEQLHPHSGAPLSVAPLTWSHAEYVITVDEFAHRVAQLRNASRRGAAAASDLVH